ncbi:hypothetical protein NOR_01144 [Metarhizium rileyi]|uniref:Uncharacterized protein n=1 Tax=Metarhizium rileyi (strain RCEF 4871) TaxID=1649241 RepID=A0A162KG88_METRR|nr:hypothetical protein NOR_01144 [Metarhizium rileyi RCEF 4871]
MPKQPLTQRPSISAPFNPIRYTGGPYPCDQRLLRGETFERVSSLDDCILDPSTSSESLASRTSRRVSESFPNTGPPSASPTVVQSEVSAFTRMHSWNSSKTSLGIRSGLLSLSSRSSAKQLSKYTLVARPESPGNAENNPPAGDDKSSRIPRSMSKLPKSKPMMVLQGLRKSFSRPTLAAVRNLSSSGRPPSPQGVTNGRQPDESQLSVSTFQSSGTTLASFSGVDSPPGSSAVTTPKSVSTAQSSAYWLGRFTAHRDKYLNEKLPNNSSCSSPSSPSSSGGDRGQTPSSPGHHSVASHRRLAYLASSSTMPALTTITSRFRDHYPEDDDNAIKERVYRRLESYPTTAEAEDSLHSWQKEHTRFLEQNRKSLEKGSKNRLLAGVDNGLLKGGERRRQLAFKGLADSRSGAIGITPGRGVAVC